MPTFFCSTKLSKLIGLKDRLPSLSMDNWNGHLFYLEGKKCLVFVHKETFYSFVIFNVTKKQLTNIKQMFIDSFIDQLYSDKIITNKTENLIRLKFQSIDISTTDGDKSTIGFMNDCIARLTWEINGQKPSISQVKKYADNFYNDVPILTQKGNTPINLMTEKLKNFA